MSAESMAVHVHRFESFSRVIEVCCDSMHYFCECGAKEPCPTPVSSGEARTEYPTGYGCEVCS